MTVLPQGKPGEAMNASTLPLLIVDDDPVFAAFVQQLVQSLGRELPREPQWVDTAEKAVAELGRHVGKGSRVPNVFILRWPSLLFPICVHLRPSAVEKRIRSGGVAHRGTTGPHELSIQNPKSES